MSLQLKAIAKCDFSNCKATCKVLLDIDHVNGLICSPDILPQGWKRTKHWLKLHDKIFCPEHSGLK